MTWIAGEFPRSCGSTKPADISALPDKQSELIEFLYRSFGTSPFSRTLRSGPFAIGSVST